MHDGIHPTTLVHWTGRGLSGVEFADRLVSIFQDGLWCNPPNTPDTVRCVGGNQFELPRNGVVCFTELSPDNSDRHVEKYGRLGIGFRRDYLLKCGANPVFYVQNGQHGIANTNLAILELVVRNGLISTGVPGLFSGPDAIGALRSLLSYFKPMSRDDSAADGAVLDFYNELEWRIAPSHMRVSDGRIITPEMFVYANGRWNFRFDPEQVALIVAPDETVKALMLSDPRLSQNLDRDGLKIVLHQQPAPTGARKQDSPDESQPSPAPADTAPDPN